MKKKTLNIITTIFGLALWVSIIPMIFIMVLVPTANVTILIPASIIFFVGGGISVWFKNVDFQAIVKTSLDKFKK